MVLSLSALLTSVIFFNLRMRLGALVPIKCRLPECMRRILPVPVILNRLAAPRCVFSFSFGFDRLRGIAVNPLVSAYFNSSGSEPLLQHPFSEPAAPPGRCLPSEAALRSHQRRRFRPTG